VLIPSSNVSLLVAIKVFRVAAM